MEQQNQQLNEIANEMLKATEAFYHAFSTAPGAKVLVHLESALGGSLLNPTAACDFQSEITPEQLIFMREGQSQVLRYIKSMIKYYKDNRNG